MRRAIVPLGLLALVPVVWGGNPYLCAMHFFTLGVIIGVRVEDFREWFYRPSPPPK